VSPALLEIAGEDGWKMKRTGCAYYASTIGKVIFFDLSKVG
jgi:hypothetical protein